MRKERKEIQSFLVENGYPSKDGDWKSSIDPDALVLIEMLNALPGVITIGSCSGHGISGYTGRVHKEKDKPYLFFVCRDLSSQFAVLNALKDINGVAEYGFVHRDIEGPFLSIYFDEYKEMVKFQENLEHEVTEITWRRDNPPPGRVSIEK